MFTYGIGIWIGKIYNQGKDLYIKNPDLSKDEKKIVKNNTKRNAKMVLILGISVDLGILLYLKYANFFLDNLHIFFRKVDYQKLNLFLPLGISFYTLQAIGYLFDVFRKKYPAERNPIRFLLFMSWFPQIIQGPIARYDQIADQLYKGHSFDFQRLGYGIQLMLWGWFKKLVIADRIALVVPNIIGKPGIHQGLIIFFAFALYGIQVYTDFSGGMDIARGFSQVIGIELKLNFNQPYFSRSIEEFWRRWHITLGSWMRDYVFYPLSLSKTFGNIGKKARKIFGINIGKKVPSFLSMFIVYFLVGFWHGSSYKYIAYGLWNSIFIMSSIMLTGVYEKTRNLLGFSQESFTYRVFQIFRTFIIVTLGRYFSGAATFKDAIRFYNNTFINWQDLSFILDGTLKNLGLDTANWFLLAAALLFLLLTDFLHERGYHIRESISKQHILFRWIIYAAAILAILIFGIYGPNYNAAAFIYAQF